MRIAYCGTPCVDLFEILYWSSNPSAQIDAIYSIIDSSMPSGATFGDKLCASWTGCGEPKRYCYTWYSPQTRAQFIQSFLDGLKVEVKACPPGS